MLDYIILGILQGIFEWLPISSEGIVALTSHFLIKDLNPVDVALFLHLGTLVAVLIYFRKDWIKVLTFKDNKLLKFLTITTIISLVIGFPIYLLMKSLVAGASLLIIMGFGLLFTAYFHKSKRKLNLKSNKLAIISGLLQGLAVIPGLSRSGSTIFGLSLGKLKPEQILKISYMMSAPIIVAASLFIIIKEPTILQGWPAIISSFIFGILTLSILMKLAKKINFFYFALVFAILCFVGGIISFLI